MTTGKNAVASDAASSDGRDSPSTSLRVKRSDRVAFLGATGSGKTTLATIMLAPQMWVVVLDPKHQFAFKIRGVVSSPKYGKELVTGNLREAARHDEPNPIIYRPSTAECDEGCTGFWEWIWNREHTIVFVDEVMAVSPPVNMPTGYKRAIQMGRSKGIGVWSCSQRPSRIPLNILSESEHFCAFELRFLPDRKRVAENTDPRILTDPARGHDFWYYNVRDREPVKLDAYKLKVK